MPSLKTILLYLRNYKKLKIEEYNLQNTSLSKSKFIYDYFLNYCHIFSIDITSNNKFFRKQFVTFKSTFALHRIL
jgi:hypothetical protein